MSRAIVDFTSSDAFMEADENACWHARVEIVGYIEGTYSDLRHSGDNDEGAGVIFAFFKDGGWELLDGRRFSDWAVKVH